MFHKPNFRNFGLFWAKFGAFWTLVSKEIVRTTQLHNAELLQTQKHKDSDKCRQGNSLSCFDRKTKRAHNGREPQTTLSHCPPFPFTRQFGPFMSENHKNILPAQHKGQLLCHILSFVRRRHVCAPQRQQKTLPHTQWTEDNQFKIDKWSQALPLGWWKIFAKFVWDWSACDKGNP